MKTKTLKILVFLFTLNSISLYIYFFSQPESHPQTPPEYSSPTIKPWPILPSHLPWSINPKIPFRSCEAYFGNGFTQITNPLKPSSQSHRKIKPSGGWFRCYYSETLRSSVCEGGGIRMDVDKIVMSNGGERLESVIGRSEDVEMPEFKDGAFEIEDEGGLRNGEKMVDQGFLNKYVQEGVVDKHTMRGLIESVRLVDASEFNCSEWIEEPTLFVTRFEYANVFHTVTDWYSAYVASRVTGLPKRPHLVFLDGHCETQLEETWRALFSSLTYAKNFTSPVCFRHVILAPLGYETALFKGLSEDIYCNGAPAHDLWQKPDDQKTARISEFGEMIRASFGLSQGRRSIPNTPFTKNILFVRREDYLAHPRHGGKVQSRLSNEEEVFESVKNWASNHSDCKLNVVNGLFAHMHMKEQVRAIQDADVIVGAHGAGLTHMVSANPGTIILEIISSEYRRPHFKLIAQWKGLEYHAINLAGSYADPLLVVDRLSGILRRIGC